MNKLNLDITSDVSALKDNAERLQSTNHSGKRESSTAYRRVFQWTRTLPAPLSFAAAGNGAFQWLAIIS